MPLKRTPIPSILQSSSSYKAKPLCDGPLVPVLLRLAQTDQHLLFKGLVEDIKCHKIYKKLHSATIRRGFVKICAKKFGKNRRFEGVPSSNCFEKRRGSYTQNVRLFPTFRRAF